MADILIRGMEMPQSCFFCKIYTHNGGNCLQLQKHVSTDRFSHERDKDCPLVEIPPHGRLVDADELELHGRQLSYLAQGFLKDGTIIHNRKLVPWKDVQTIVPAEGEDEE